MASTPARLSFATLSSGRRRGAIPGEARGRMRARARVRPRRARDRRRSGAAFVPWAEGWPSMSMSAWRTIAPVRPRGARSDGGARPLRAVPRSCPCSAAGRLSARARLCPEKDGSVLCDNRPEQAEAGPVPADHGVWLDNDKHVRPARPEPGENEPEGAVTFAQARAGRDALEVGQLLAQGEVLDCEVRAGAEGGTQRSKETEEQGTHRVIMHDGEAWRPNPLSIIATVGKHTSRTTSWRTTGAGAFRQQPDQLRGLRRVKPEAAACPQRGFFDAECSTQNSMIS